MGSALVREISYGKTASEAYDRAVDDAKDYYGHQEGYSGAINATQGFREHKVPEGITYGTKKWDKYIQNLIDKLSKFDGCLAIELPKKMWRDVTVNKVSGASAESIVTKGTRKWDTVYGIFSNVPQEINGRRSIFNTERKLVKELSNKAEAIKYAKAYSIKYDVEVEIEVKKKLVGASPLVAKIKPNRKPVKEKEKAYLFIGFASC